MNELNSFSRQEIKEIAEEYARNDVSRSHFCEKYFISETTFYNMLDKAIIEHFVSFDIALRMKKRAIENRRKRLNDNSKGVKSTENHYHELFEKRKYFLFSKKRRIRILIDFANRDLKESKAAFCEANTFDLELLEKVLIKSIVYDELPKKVYSKILNNSLLSGLNNARVLEFFKILELKKNEVKSGKEIDIHYTYLDMYRHFFPTSKVTYEEEDIEEEKSLPMNEDGEIIDDGYSILD